MKKSLVLAAAYRLDRPHGQCADRRRQRSLIRRHAAAEAPVSRGFAFLDG
ncbi:hypothetical protein [Silanimonas sp.]|jgi:hypothetical protein